MFQHNDYYTMYLCFRLGYAEFWQRYRVLARRNAATPNACASNSHSAAGSKSQCADIVASVFGDEGKENNIKQAIFGKTKIFLPDGHVRNRTICSKISKFDQLVSSRTNTGIGISASTLIATIKLLKKSLELSVSWVLSGNMLNSGYLVSYY